MLGRWLSSLSARCQAVGVALLVYGLGVGVPAYANQYQTQYEAWSACSAQANAYQSQSSTYTWTCKVAGPQYYMLWVTGPNTASFTGTTYRWTTDGGSPNPCGSVPSVHMYIEGKMLSGTTFRQNQKDAMENWVPCTMTWTPTGVPTLNPNTGQWETYGVATATGNPASTGSKPTGEGVGDWVDASGAPVSPQPAPTTQTPTDNTSPPQSCGGGSCYDPKTDQYCATSGGQQLCVSGATGRSSTGGCASKGDAALCVGSPSSPRPAPPPASPISDPPTAIRTSDTVTQANKSTGANQTVIVTVYAPPGVQVGTGQKPGDTTKPMEQWCATDETGVKHCVPKTDPGTSYCVTLGDGSKVCEPKDGKDKGTASGGQDCNAPPICSGDQPTCMVIDQQWLTRCRPRFGEDANGQPNWTKVGDADGAGYATTDTPRSAVVSEVDGPGVDALDTSGFAGNTCPALPPFEAFGQSYSFDQDMFCRWLGILRSVILLVAAFVSARILASGGKG